MLVEDFLNQYLLYIIYYYYYYFDYKALYSLLLLYY